MLWSKNAASSSLHRLFIPRLLFSLFQPLSWSLANPSFPAHSLFSSPSPVCRAWSAPSIMLDFAVEMVLPLLPYMAIGAASRLNMREVGWGACTATNIRFLIWKHAQLTLTEGEQRGRERARERIQFFIMKMLTTSAIKLVIEIKYNRRRTGMQTGFEMSVRMDAVLLNCILWLAPLAPDGFLSFPPCTSPLHFSFYGITEISLSHWKLSAAQRIFDIIILFMQVIYLFQ